MMYFFLRHRSKRFRDGLGDIANRYPSLDISKDVFETADHPQLQFTDTSGVDIALDLVESNPPGSITYIALGPLTTLAQIIMKSNETFAERIGQVVCMGGNLDVPGNTTPVAECTSIVRVALSPLSEFFGAENANIFISTVNFFADPYAVHTVLPPPSSMPPPFPHEKFILLPLDITTQHELPFPSYIKHVDSAFPPTPEPSQILDTKTEATRTPLVYFTSAFFSRTREVMLKFGKDAMELHDIAAVWYAIDNPPGSKAREGWELVRREFQIERYTHPFPFLSKSLTSTALH